ncbi:hypothetical protein, partial [Propionicimonas sp.]|uniref:TreTu family toxin n=1 Tax=Propionicimonas sp. TaxID=1955623 RepID=UPI001DD89D15
AAIAANGIDGTATQVWEGITKPYTSRWESGDQAGAIGYGAAELLITLAGTKGATKIGTTATKIETSIATKTGDDLTRVGRWMNDEELAKMQESGQVQVGGGGTTHVADPPDMATYAKQAAPGSRYVEFDVPKKSLFPSGWPGGAQIPGPDHIIARLAARRGSPVQFPVPACNIVVVGSC